MTEQEPPAIGPTVHAVPLERMAAGEIPARHLTTHPMPLADAVRGYETFQQKQDGCIRAVFHP
ncbi:MAG TPA: hypothetical protein VK306_05965 [Acidimicrobiales bacterium]|nr:hypothetical protein [Acidimicrobiales bacterium]